MDTLTLYPNTPYRHSSFLPQFMASALTSNSFLSSTTPPHSRLSLKTARLTVSAKNSGPFPAFRLGKRSDDSSSGEIESDESPKSNPFRFNFGNLPDVKSLVPVVASPATGLAFGNQRRKDPSTVFVAGATGQAGVRIAQQLLREGFSVRAGVPELGAAQELARLAASYKIISKEQTKRLNAVESNFQDAKSIAKAIGNASKVVVTIGPAENGPSTEVTPSDALQVIQAAQLAGVAHVAIVYDGSTFSASTNNVLDGISSFFNNLFSGSQSLTISEFLKSVVETTDVRYTLIKTELTADYSPESSYKVVVSAEGSSDANDYKVTMSQIASLVSDVFSNTAVAENKVVQVFTDPTAPSKSVDELFGPIPEDGRRKAYADAIAKAKAEEEAIKASERAKEAAEAAKKLGEEVKKLEVEEARAANLAKEAEEKATAAGTSVNSLLDKAKDMTSGLSWEKLSSQLTSAVQTTPTEKPKVQIATVRGQAKARTLNAKKAVTKKPQPQPKPSKPKTEPTEAQGEVRKVFGGLFQQQTIYIDDD